MKITKTKNQQEGQLNDILKQELEERPYAWGEGERKPSSTYGNSPGYGLNYTPPPTASKNQPQIEQAN